MTELYCFKAHDVCGEIGVNIDEDIAHRIGCAVAQRTGLAPRGNRTNLASITDFSARSRLCPIWPRVRAGRWFKPIKYRFDRRVTSG